MEVENGSLQYEFPFMVNFHFHDYGRKGKLAPENQWLEDDSFPFGKAYL